MESQVRGGTRWKRFALVMVPSVAATAALGVALAQGALAASFSVSGQSFKVSADELVGTDFVQYGGVAEGHDLEGKAAVHPVAISGFKHATITDMCQSVVTPVPLLGTSVTLTLNAGTTDPNDEENKVQADNLYLDVESLEADKAKFDGMDIGIAAGDNRSPGMAEGMPGGKFPSNKFGFAQQARSVTLTGVKQTAWATTAGTFTLPKLRLGLKVGKPEECY